MRDRGFVAQHPRKMSRICESNNLTGILIDDGFATFNFIAGEKEDELGGLFNSCAQNRPFDKSAHHAEWRINGIGRLNLTDTGKCQYESNGKCPPGGPIEVAVRIEHAGFGSVNKNIEFSADFSTLNNRTLLGVGTDHINKKLIHTVADFIEFFCLDSLISIFENVLDILGNFEIGNHPMGFLLVLEKFVPARLAGSLLGFKPPPLGFRADKVIAKTLFLLFVIVIGFAEFLNV